MKGSLSTLVRICTGHTVDVGDLRNLNIAQYKELHRRFTRLEKLHGSGHSIIVSNSKSIQRLESLVPQLMIVLGGFSATVLKLLRRILCTDLESYALLREMHCTILRAPIFGNKDSLHFTDALGRAEQLPYQYFRHWDIFEAMLRCKFKELPGEKLVAKGQYHILDMRRKHVVIDRSKWQRSVFPGVDITMSMAILGILFERGACPRVACGTPNAQYPSESTFITWSVLEM